MDVTARFGKFDLNLNPIETIDVTGLVEATLAETGRFLLPKDLTSVPGLERPYRADGQIELSRGSKKGRVPASGVGGRAQAAREARSS